LAVGSITAGSLTLEVASCQLAVGSITAGSLTLEVGSYQLAVDSLLYDLEFIGILI